MRTAYSPKVLKRDLKNAQELCDLVGDSEEWRKLILKIIWGKKAIRSGRIVCRHCGGRSFEKTGAVPERIGRRCLNRECDKSQPLFEGTQFYNEDEKKRSIDPRDFGFMVCLKSVAPKMPLIVAIDHIALTSKDAARPFWRTLEDPLKKTPLLKSGKVAQKNRSRRLKVALRKGTKDVALRRLKIILRKMLV